MYKVYCNEKLLFNDRYETLKIFDATATFEVGKTGVFDFTIYPEHPYYEEVKEMVAMVEIHRNDEVIFYGRVLNIQYGFYNEKQVTCEGELAFLLDSLIPPHTYGSSFSGYLEYVLDQHNSQVDYDKRFEVGNITVGDFTPFTVVENLEYVNALETLNKRMVEASGGYLSVHHEDGIKYLDLLAYNTNEYNVISQSIRLGRNLLDVRRESNSEDVFSVIVPLGAKEENSEIRLDVKNVNSGLAYIENEEAISLYGRIYKQVTFDNITQPQTLLETATSYLAQNYAGISTIEITASDLSAIEDIDSFMVGQWVNVYDTVHFAENALSFMISKMKIDILNPLQTQITLGKVKKGLTESILGLGETSSSSSGSSGSSGTEEQPYLMESGKTGIWSWSRYSDNTCEFFGKVPITNASVSQTFGSWYRGANLYEANAYSYPFQMTEAPALEMTFQTRNGLGALLWIFSIDADTAQSYLPQSYLIRPSTATGIYGNINVIGRGKL